MAKVVLWTSLLILTSVASSSSVMSRASGQCPDKWAAFGDSCYRVIEKYYTWLNAQAICKTLGSSLAVIESKEEDAFLVNLARNYVSCYKVNTLIKCDGTLLWIGLTDLVQEKYFTWVDTAQVPTYTNWGFGEPNNSGGDEDCATLFHEGRWYDINCEMKSTAICEKHSSS